MRSRTIDQSQSGPTGPHYADSTVRQISEHLRSGVHGTGEPTMSKRPQPELGPVGKFVVQVVIPVFFTILKYGLIAGAGMLSGAIRGSERRR